jgi:pimeloyl-ACP methyl ester carboxylesterase
MGKDMSMRPPFSIGTTHIRTDDGVSLAVHATEEPFPGAPVVLLANGLGGPLLAWRPIIDDLRDRYRIVTWDYRGLYGSTKPPEENAAAYSIPRHVDDLAAVLRSQNVKEASLVGWSMGVQVVIEAYAAMPGLAKNLVLLNGTFGRPLHSAAPVAFLGPLVPRAVAIAESLHVVVGEATRRVSTFSKTVRLLKGLGLIGEGLDDEECAELVRSFGKLDMQAYLRNLSALGEHDASPILRRIDVPTLVITGDRDRMTPRGLSQQMVRKIPHAEILLVRGGTHYTAVEFPELVNLRIEKFYRDSGFHT